MRRTCSGVMGWLVADVRGGVVGRSVPAMVNVVRRFGWMEWDAGGYVVV
jgi:hypothetical protein